MKRAAAWLLVASWLGCRPSAPQRTADAQPQPMDETACVDHWLVSHRLDAFGAPMGTVYAGGTPLFDEATGETMSRLEYVYIKQPEARRACGP
jgi:hypothetical protein